MKIDWKRVLSVIGLSGVLATIAFVFGAGRVAESTAHALEDHESRLEKIEPRVEMIPAIREGVDELRKDIREIRDFLMPRPKGR